MTTIPVEEDAIEGGVKTTLHHLALALRVPACKVLLLVHLNKACAPHEAHAGERHQLRRPSNGLGDHSDQSLAQPQHHPCRLRHTRLILVRPSHEGLQRLVCYSRHCSCMWCGVVWCGVVWCGVSTMKILKSIREASLILATSSFRKSFTPHHWYSSPQQPPTHPTD